MLEFLSRYEKDNQAVMQDAQTFVVLYHEKPMSANGWFCSRPDCYFNTESLPVNWLVSRLLALVYSIPRFNLQSSVQLFTKLDQHYATCFWARLSGWVCDGFHGLELVMLSKDSFLSDCYWTVGMSVRFRLGFLTRCASSALASTGSRSNRCGRICHLKASSREAERRKRSWGLSRGFACTSPACWLGHWSSTISLKA